MRDQVHLCANNEALAGHTRDWLVQLIQKHHAEHESPFSLALAGGSTPQRLYELLGQLPAGTIDWNRILLLWGDERNVAPEHKDSNFRMVKDSLLQAIDIPAENVLGVPSPGGDPQAAASSYEALLREKLPASESRFPKLSCVLLGMGDDVHTASLFPGTEALSEQSRWVVANHVPKLDCWRITFTAPLINAAENVAFLLSGSKKQPALAVVWNAPYNPQQYPSQLIKPEPGVLWYLLDKEAMGTTPIPESVMVQIL